jgi:PTH1 family peptidyl-tRNA hydrolase
MGKKIEASDYKEDKYSNAYIAKAKTVFNGKKVNVLLVKPQTFVNNSGFTAGKLKAKLKLKPEDFVLIHDDLDIPFGNTKLSFEKNAAGHHGVESVSKALKTIKYWRMRVGTQNRALIKANDGPAKKKEKFVVDFVLGEFSKAECDELKDIFKEAREKIETKK